MSSTLRIWYAIPTANQLKAIETFNVWKARGYQCAALLNNTAPEDGLAECCGLVLGRKEYKGYSWAVNTLCRYLLQLNLADIIITGGDDIYPDPSTDPQQLGKEFIEHFKGTFGVMQPTGDVWMLDDEGRGAAERVCGSPWMGAEFCKRMYGGNGPLFEGYYHFYEDEELQEVVSKLGVLWQRKDISQEHKHWSRGKTQKPAYLKKANELWAESKELFNSRKAAGFPGHEPLP